MDQLCCYTTLVCDPLANYAMPSIRGEETSPVRGIADYFAE